MLQKESFLVLRFLHQSPSSVQSLRSSPSPPSPPSPLDSPFFTPSNSISNPSSTNIIKPPLFAFIRLVFFLHRRKKFAFPFLALLSMGNHRTKERKQEEKTIYTCAQKAICTNIYNSTDLMH